MGNEKALVTLGMIETLDARARWVALFVQSFVLLFSARRSRLRIVKAATALVWGVSLACFLLDTYERGYFRDPASLVSNHGLSALAYLFLSTAFFCFQAKWLGIASPRDPTPTSQANTPDLRDRANEPRQVLNVAYGTLLAYLGLAVIGSCFHAELRPLGAGVLAAVMATIALTARHWLPLLPAAVLLLSAHLRCWALDTITADLRLVWLNVAIVVAVTIVAAVAASHSKISEPSGEQARSLRLPDGVLHLLWTFSLHVAFYLSLSAENYLLACVATSLCLAALSVHFPFRVLREISFAPMAYALAGLAHATVSPDGYLPHLGPEISLWLATVGAFGHAAAILTWKRLKQEPGVLTEGGRQWLHCLLATLLGLTALVQAFDVAENAMLAAAITAPLAALLVWRPGLTPMLFCAVLFSAYAHIRCYDLTLRSAATTGLLAYDARYFWTSVGTGILALGYGVLAGRLPHGFSRKTLSTLQAIHASAAVILLFLVFYLQGGRLHNYTTVLWGVSSIGILLAGLAERSKPLRIVGLTGLALCLPRAFLADIVSTWHRILAFGVLGFVLLLVGYLYNRFRALIEKEAA